MAELELFTGQSTPFGQRVEIALKEKKIPYKRTVVDFQNKPQALLEANPIHKKVPAIIHNGRAVAESLVILEYLEDAFPEHVPLMPKDAFEKSKVRFWTDFTDKAFMKMVKTARTKGGTPEKQAAIEESVNTLKTIEDGMTSLSADGPFFAGEKFGNVDSVLAPLCTYQLLFKELGGIVIPGPEELPRLNKWLDVVKVHPSVSSTLPPEEETLRHMLAIVAKRAAASQ